MLRPLSWTLLIALLLAGVVPAHAQLATTETEGVRFVYLPGTQDYLVPHAARTFLNALRLPQEAVRLRALRRRSPC